jgi:hypothetical protein
MDKRIFQINFGFFLNFETLNPFFVTCINIMSVYPVYVDVKVNYVTLFTAP